MSFFGLETPGLVNENQYLGPLAIGWRVQSAAAGRSGRATKRHLAASCARLTDHRVPVPRRKAENGRVQWPVSFGDNFSFGCADGRRKKMTRRPPPPLTSRRR